MNIKTKEEFDNVIDKIKNVISTYEKNVLSYNQYLFYLANGEQISFEIAPQFVPHLVGVNLDYLKSTGYFKIKEAYELLSEFLDNSYFVYKNIQNGHLTANRLFSKYIIQKLNAFDQIAYYFNPEDVEFICKYDRTKAYQLGLDKSYPFDYFIAKKDNEGNISALGLVKQGNVYNPMTNVYLPNDETQFSSLKGVLMNQVLTYPAYIAINNSVTNFNNHSRMPVLKKIEELTILKKYATSVKGVSIDTSKELQFTLKGYLMKDDKINTYKNICEDLKMSIKKHEIFLEEACDLENNDKEMKELIRTYNNEVCNLGNSKAKASYSELLDKYKELESKVKMLEESLDITKQNNEIYQEKIQVLEQENSEYKSFQEDILEVVRKRSLR